MVIKLKAFDGWDQWSKAEYADRIGEDGKPIFGEDGKPLQELVKRPEITDPASQHLTEQVNSWLQENIVVEDQIKKIDRKILLIDGSRILHSLVILYDDGIGSEVK